MRARWLGAVMCGGAVLGLASVVLPARQQAGNPPGQPTPAVVHVGNRGAEQALPVVVQSGSDVQPVAVVSAPVISLAENARVSSRAVAQPWEYRIVAARADELVSTLDKAGLDGWEAVGLLPAMAAADVRVLLKRPK